MFQNESFVNEYKNRWNCIKDKLKLYIDNYFDEQYICMENACRYNFNRWEILGVYVYPNASGYKNRCTYSDEVLFLKDWLINRYIFFDNFVNTL